MVKVRNARTHYADGERLRHAYHSFGSKGTVPIVLLHGFPDNATAWMDVAHELEDSFLILTPYMRGCNPAIYQETTPRDGCVAARAGDLIEFLDRLGIDKPILVGQDMGAQTAQAVAMLAPERVEKLVILNGHGLYNMAVAMNGAMPSLDTLRVGWYQWLFQTPLGRPMLEADPRAFARYLWSLWSPGWKFSDAEFEDAARSFGKDWVDTMLAAYQPHEPEDKADAKRQSALQSFPKITAPTLNLQGKQDGVDLFGDTQLGQEAFYEGGFEQRILPSCGHFLHREKPELVAKEIRSFLGA